MAHGTLTLDPLSLSYRTRKVRGSRGHKKGRELYRGRINKVSKDGLYAFVEFSSISRVTAGAVMRIPKRGDDLFLHIAQNRDLESNLLEDQWIIFRIDIQYHTAREVLVFDAYPDTEIPAPR